jgi:hypothetical protein
MDGEHGEYSTGYTQVIGQSASKSSPVKINAWSHYAVWLAFVIKT